MDKDTENVLNENWPRNVIASGCPEIDSPIFDRMAAERFGREE